MVKIVIKCEKIKQFYCEVNKSKAHLNIVQLQFFVNSANYTYLNVDLKT